MSECKGLFYKFYRNVFINKKGHLITTEKLIPLKRISCKGCQVCENLIENLKEDLSLMDRLPTLERPQVGKIYQLIIDWVFDECYLKFVEVEKKEGE